MKTPYKMLTVSSLSLLMGSSALLAQNIPDGSTAPSGSVTTVIISPPEPFLSGITPNYTRTFIPTIPISNFTAVDSNTPASYAEAVFTYTDGFNRAFQTISRNKVKTGTGYNDLVFTNDNRIQRETYSFLPYSVPHNGNLRAEPFDEQKNYYQSAYPDDGYTSYSRAQYFSNSTTRATRTFIPGKSQTGQSRMVTHTKVANNANEVRSWDIDASGYPVSSGYYPADRLFGNKVTDQEGNVSVVFTDMYGRTVLKKRQDGASSYALTYYVYDRNGLLRYILPPKASAAAGGGTVSAAVRNNLCFQYQYDEKGRPGAIRKPGETDFTSMVYDRKRRPVMRQTPDEKAAGQWEVTFYDPQFRVIATGLFNNTGSRATWQNFFDNYAGASYATSNIRYYLVTDAGEGKYPPETGVTNLSPMSYTWYDNYIALDAGNALFSNCINTLDFTDTLNTTSSEQPLRSLRTQGLVTGSKVKILTAPGADVSKTGDWRQSYTWYDDKGRVIFTLSKDLYQGNAIHTHYTGSQYDFNNRLLISKHISINSNSADGATTHTELTKNIYEDVTGNLIETGHQVDGGPWKILSKYEYDELGRVKREVLGNYGEVRDYDYNIRGQLSGINGEYAETGSATGYQQSRSFGESLKYDYGMTQPRYDGKVAGMIWRGAGGTDATMRAYGYDYDQSGRMSRADFREYRDILLGAYDWDNQKDDRSVKDLTYDKNGNILSMTQRGTGLNASLSYEGIDIDHMTYAYGANSNQLLSVTDTVTIDHGVGDFQDGHTDGPDYSYDANGNLSKDLNKNITNITYTHFNKPQTITYGNGVTISYSYDAGGSKVQELVTEGTKIKRTDYIGNFIYRNDSVQFISTATGRTVWQNDTAKEEFFVKDHLGNVRSVVDVFTYPPVAYLASYEIASANLETMIFDQVDEIRDDKPNTTDPEDQQAGRLNGTDPTLRIGTSLLLKVMAGDKIELSVDNYYNEGYMPENDEPVNAEDLVGSIVSTLQGGAGGFEGSESHNTGLVEKLFTPENYLAADELMHAEPDDTKPKAFLNYILFNSRMEVVSTFTGAFQVNGNGAWGTIGTPAPLVIPEGGYLAVFESTQTAIQCDGCEASASDVYFDQLMVRFTRGQLKEESHYYPFGLPMGDMGSAAAGFTPNRSKYQSNEYIKDAGLNWMDFHARQYDPQIGRFLNLDPLAVIGGQDRFSPYAAMGNQPVSMTDPGGMQQKETAISPFFGYKEGILNYTGPGSESEWFADMAREMSIRGMFASGDAANAFFAYKAAQDAAAAKASGGSGAKGSDKASVSTNGESFGTTGYGYGDDGAFDHYKGGDGTVVLKEVKVTAKAIRSPWYGNFVTPGMLIGYYIFNEHMNRFGSWMESLLPVGHDVHEINDQSHQNAGTNFHSKFGQNEEAKTADKVEDGGSLDDFLDWVALMGGGSGGLKNFSATAGRVEDFSAALQNAVNALRRINGGISGKTPKTEYLPGGGISVEKYTPGTDTNMANQIINSWQDSVQNSWNK